MEKEKRTTTSLRMSKEDTKALKLFCLQNDLTVQEFLEFASKHCMKNKILPKNFLPKKNT